MLSAKALRAVIGSNIEKLVVDAISEFACKDKDVEHFLKNRAIEFERRDKSRTYLIVDDKEYIDGIISIVAYFTLSLKSLEFRESLSKSKIKDVDGFSKEVRNW